MVISCSAGKYLPANSHTCTTCTDGNFCVGVSNAISSGSNQGIEGCPEGFSKSDGARTKKENCYAKGTNYECKGHNAYSSCDGEYHWVGGYWAYGNFAGDDEHLDGGYSYTGYKCLESSFVCGNGANINSNQWCYLYRHNNCYGKNWGTKESNKGYSHCDCRAEIATTAVDCKKYYGTDSCI